MVDPEVVTVGCVGSDPADWFLQEPSETLELVRDTFEPMGIKVHCPSQIRAPCSLNLVQFPDNRVLMTGGDSEVKEAVSNIVGSQNVFTTAAVIKFHPLLRRGGIRCLLGKIPEPFLVGVTALQ